uniref:SGNH/GDSL hydrolase family protein n=1 Tax=Desulfobacca acetoxidans TaxID=60893 RepID=A0A7V6A3B5_9BACT
MRDRLVSFTGLALMVALILATVEIAAYFYSTYLARRYGILFYLPQITEDYATYAARVNPRLGWPSSQALQKQQDDMIAMASAPGTDLTKIDREFPISAYGDSFTAGFGVKPEYAWSNVLGRMLGCHIANYGIPGYGTDQAYLRFHDNNQDGAKIVLFGVLSENIQRNVNQLRNFLIPSSQCQTKPRFVLDNQGHVQFVPLPKLTAQNYEDFIQNPDHYLSHDYFVPGGPSGAQKLEFPYTWSILKAHKFFYDRYVLGYKSYLQFYLPHHPSQAFPLTLAIIKQCISEVQKRGKHPIVLVFPTDEDFRVYHRHFVYAPLIHALKREHIEYIDLGTEILKRLGSRSYMELFLGGQYHHFNENGNKLVARILFDYFKAKRYLPVSVQETATLPPG